MRFSTILSTLEAAAISVLAAAIEKRAWNGATCGVYYAPQYGITWNECMCLQPNGSVSYYEWNTKAFDNIGDGCFPPGKLFGPDFTYIPGYNPNPPGFLRSVGEGKTIQKKQNDDSGRNKAGCKTFADPVFNVTQACQCQHEDGTSCFYEFNTDTAKPPTLDGCNPPWQIFGPDEAHIPGYNPHGIF